MRKLIKKISAFFYSIPRVLFINFYRIFSRARIVNPDKIPGDKSAILAINHTVDADPIILLSAIRKKIFFIAESENFGNWLSNFFMRRFANSVPVFKAHFLKNVKSFKELLNISKNKNVLFGIFPEGMLNKKGGLKKIQKGAAYFSYKTRLPIIPVYMHNTNKGPDSKKWIWKNRITRGILSIIINSFRKISILIGEPIYPIKEKVMRKFKGFTDPVNYKKIINKINDTLEKEFMGLAGEADDLFGIRSKDLDQNDTATQEKC